MFKINWLETISNPNRPNCSGPANLAARMKKKKLPEFTESCSNIEIDIFGINNLFKIEIAFYK